MANSAAFLVISRPESAPKPTRVCLKGKPRGLLGDIPWNLSLDDPGVPGRLDSIPAPLGSFRYRLKAARPDSLKIKEARRAAFDRSACPAPLT